MHIRYVLSLLAAASVLAFAACESARLPVEA
jgi:hypothetical protein